MIKKDIMIKFSLFLICACGPLEPVETTSIPTTSSSTSVETFGNSTSISGTSGTSGVVPTEAMISTTSSSSSSTSTMDSSSGEFCTIGRPNCPLKKDFESCVESIECEGGICITNETGASFCTSSCNRIGIECDIGECFGENFCVHFCDIEECPENMICGTFFEKMVCFNDN